MTFEIDFNAMGVGLALTVRFAVLMATMPLLSLRSVPPLWRFGVAACFAAVLTPPVAAGLEPGVVTLAWRPLVLEAVRSLAVGAMLGFTVNLVFTAVRFAGSVAGMQVGFAIVNAFDPMSESQVSIISQFYYMLAVLLFFVTGAHQTLVAAMYDSCVAVPPFASVNAAGGAWHLLGEFSSIFVNGLRIAAPIVLVLLLVSASMGVIVKTVPQLNVLVVGFPIKIGVGVLVLGLSLVFYRNVVMSLFGGLQGDLGNLLLAIR